MTLTTDEFIRRFLLHVLPASFHRIRHYGLIANTTRQRNLAQARKLLLSKQPHVATDAHAKSADTAHSVDASATYVCPECGAPMHIIESFLRGQQPRAPPTCRGEV